MADIMSFKKKEFFLKKDKEQKEENGDKKELPLQHKIARHKVLVFYRVCIIIALAAIFLLFLYFHWRNMIYTDYEVKQQYTWSRSGEAKCINLNGVLFSYSKDGMNCTDAKGNVLWNQTYEMQNPILRTCKNVVAIGDYNGRSIYVSNTEGNMGTIDTTMPIRDFCVSASGVVAAVLDDSKVTAIYLYSVSGEQLAYFKTTMSKSGYPMAIAISDDSKKVAVSYLKADSGKVSSSIGFYNFSAVGQNYTDNLVGGYGYSDAVVPMVEFMNGDCVFAVADNRLMFYQGKQIPVNTTDILITDEIQSVFYDANHVGLVFRSSSGDMAYRLELYDVNGKKENVINFNTEYNNIVFDASGIIIYNENECSIYDWGGKLKYSNTFKERVECIIPTGNIARYTIVTDSEIQMIELK